MNTHVVLKPFTGSGDKKFESGEQVDARNWRTVDRLVAHRYLRPIPPDEIGRQMIEPPRQRRGKEATDGN